MRFAKPNRSADEMAYAAQFGAKLRAARESLGLSRNAVGRLVQTSGSQVERWEAGAYTPSLYRAHLLRRSLLAKAAELVEGSRAEERAA